MEDRDILENPPSKSTHAYVESNGSKKSVCICSLVPRPLLSWTVGHLYYLQDNSPPMTCFFHPMSSQHTEFTYTLVALYGV